MASWRHLGERLRELREARGLTRDQLAQRARVSAIYIRKLEAGDRVSPALPTLERIAEALGATVTLTLEVKRRR